MIRYSMALAELNVVTAAGSSDGKPFPFDPSYAQIDLLTDAVRASGSSIRLVVEVPGFDIVSPPIPPLWAFVSVTNNTTQQVTIIKPHP